MFYTHSQLNYAVTLLLLT